MPKYARFQKWGNKLALVIPAKLARERKIEAGTIVDLDSLRVRPLHRRIKLSELMAQYKPKHRHGEWDLAEPVGNEVC